MITVSLVAYAPTELDEQISRHTKQATVFKREKDLSAAAQSMEKVFQLLKVRGDGPSSRDLWVRYPSFLQHAGQFDKAVEVFEWLLANAETLAEKESCLQHQPRFIRLGYAHLLRTTIFDSMRIAFNREKLKEDAERYKVLADQSRAQFTKFSALADLHFAREAAKSEKRLADRFSDRCTRS